MTTGEPFHSVDERRLDEAIASYLKLKATGQTPVREPWLALYPDLPPVPSQRLPSSDTLPSIAARRHIEPARLTKLIRGDLDWIVMKALE